MRKPYRDSMWLCSVRGETLGIKRHFMRISARSESEAMPHMRQSSLSRVSNINYLADMKIGIAHPVLTRMQMNAKADWQIAALAPTRPAETEREGVTRVRNGDLHQAPTAKSSDQALRLNIWGLFYWPRKRRLLIGLEPYVINLVNMQHPHLTDHADYENAN